MQEKENLIQKLSFDFAIKIIKLYKVLQSKNGFIVSKQLLRSATSIGANIEEALAGSSKRDFLNKMCIASKETRETRYWLNIFDKSDLVDVNVSEYLLDITKIIGILIKIVKTTSIDSK